MAVGVGACSRKRTTCQAPDLLVKIHSSKLLKVKVLVPVRASPAGGAPDFGTAHLAFFLYINKESSLRNL